MSYTTNQLITEAYYASDIVGRGYEQPSSVQMASGLRTLNGILTATAYQKGTIPYFTEYDFVSVIGQEAYPIPNLLEARILTFTINSVRFALQYQGRDSYFGSFRANDIQSLMFVNHIERTKEGATLYMYFKPDQNYPCKIWGLFRLDPVTQFQDLELTFAKEYLYYLLYTLARNLCIDDGRDVPPNLESKYDEIYESLNNTSASIDLSVKKVSTFGNIGSPNYGMANLGKGWLPPGMM